MLDAGPEVHVSGKKLNLKAMQSGVTAQRRVGLALEGQWSREEAGVDRKCNSGSVGPEIPLKPGLASQPDYYPDKTLWLLVGSGYIG